MKWEKVKLGDLCNMNSGGTPRRGTVGYYGGEIPWVKISDIEDAIGGVIFTTEEYITKDGLKSIGNRVFPEGTLLLAMYGSVGKTAIAGVDLSTNQAILGIRIIDSTRLSIKYLKYWLGSIKEQLLNRAVGGTLQNISLGIVKELFIPLPPLHIQEQIADTLDKADALRRKDQALLQKYDELAQAIFYDMFGDPVKNEKGYKITTVEEVSLKVTDGEHSTPQRTETGIKLLSARNIKNGYLDFDAGLDYIPEVEFIRISKRCNPELNDILISCSGTIGRICAVRTKENYGLVRSVALVKYKQNLLKRDYLEFFMQTDYFQKAIWRNVNTSSQSNLFTGQLKKLPVLVPPLQLQSDFEMILSSLFKSKEICKKEMSYSSNLFQSLMDKYYS